MVLIWSLLLFSGPFVRYFYVERRLILRQGNYRLAANASYVLFTITILVMLLLGSFDRSDDRVVSTALIAFAMCYEIRFALKYRGRK